MLISIVIETSFFAIVFTKDNKNRFKDEDLFA